MPTCMPNKPHQPASYGTRAAELSSNDAWRCNEKVSGPMGLGLFCGRVFAVMDAVTLLPPNVAQNDALPDSCPVHLILPRSKVFLALPSSV